MACADQSVNDQEAAFNQAMSSVTAFEISNGQLDLKDATGTIVLTFVTG
jgi:heat shock protein HslJ